MKKKMQEEEICGVARIMIRTHGVLKATDLITMVISSFYEEYGYQELEISNMDKFFSKILEDKNIKSYPYTTDYAACGEKIVFIHNPED
jgi:hypothetical protein